MAADKKSAGLTERRIRDLKPGPKTRILWDREVTGLGVRITPAGSKSFILNYRVNGRERRATLARCSEISLREARERAGRELAAIRNGEADPLERRRGAREAPTVADGVQRFFEEYVPRRIADGRMSTRTKQDYRKQATLTILPGLGKRKIADVTRADIERAVAPRAPVQRNRTLALISRLFNLFEDWEWRAQNTNPARRIEKAREEPRDRILAPSELAALAAALNGLEDKNPAPVAAIRLAALTGLRIGEVRMIRWEEVSFETGRLILPQTKTGRRTHDLPTPALEILAALPRINDWCFTIGRGAPLTYRTVRQHFADAARAAGLDDVRLHDLRRTVMTSAAAAGVGTHILRDLLGHKTAAMADRYVRAVGNPVRDAREQVGAAMAAMMRGEAGEVVPMRRRRDG